MKASSNLTNLYKFAYQAAGHTLPPSPTRHSPDNKNSPGNRSQSSLPRNSPPSHHNQKDKISSHSAQPRPFLDISRKPEVPKRTVRESAEKNSADSKTERKSSTGREPTSLRKDSQHILPTERELEDNGSKLRDSQRKSGNGSSERLKSDKSLEKNASSERKGVKVEMNKNQGEKAKETERNSENRKSQEIHSKRSDEKELSSQRNKKVETKESGTRKSPEVHSKRSEEKELSSQRNKKFETKEKVDSPKYKTEPQDNNVKIVIKNADEVQKSVERESTKPMPHFNENSPSLIGSPVQYQTITAVENGAFDLETLLNKSESPVYHYYQAPQDQDQIYENTHTREMHKKVKEYRERNPYPCYAQATFKGIISRKKKSKGRSEKLRAIPRGVVEKHSEYPASLSLHKESEELGDRQSRRVATEESPVILQALMKKNLDRQAVQAQENNFRRGRKHLAPIPKNESKSREKSVISNEASSLERLEGEPKVNHIKKNIERCSSISRLSSLEREKEQNELENKKEKRKKKNVETDQSLVEVRKILPSTDPNEKYGGDNPVARNAIIMDKLKHNYINFLERKKIVPKQQRKLSRIHNEKSANIKNVYGIEDSTQKIEELLKPMSKESRRDASASDVRTKSEASPIISNIRQRSSSSLVEPKAKGNIVVEDNTGTYKAQSANERSRITITPPRMNSRERIENDRLFKPVLGPKDYNSRNLSPDNAHQNMHNISLLNQSAIEQGVYERGNSIGHINLPGKRSISTLKQIPPHRTCFNDPERSPGPKYDLSSYKGFGEPKKEELESLFRKESKTALDNRATNRSYHTLVKDNDAGIEDAGKESQFTTFLQPSSYRSTIVSGKGVNFGKSKREILYPLKNDNPGPGKYEMPQIVQKGIRFGNERKSLKFFFPKLKNIKIANPV